MRTLFRFNPKIRTDFEKSLDLKLESKATTHTNSVDYQLLLRAGPLLTGMKGLNERYERYERVDLIESEAEDEDRREQMV